VTPFQLSSSIYILYELVQPDASAIVESHCGISGILVALRQELTSFHFEKMSGKVRLQYFLL
jgi:hypothetical protein